MTRDELAERIRVTIVSSDERERRIDDVLGVVGIVLALRAEGERRLAQLGDASPRILASAIISAIDDGISIHEATAAVIESMEGGN